MSKRFMPLRPLRSEDMIRATVFHTDAPSRLLHLLNRADRLGLGETALEEIYAEPASPEQQVALLEALIAEA